LRVLEASTERRKGVRRVGCPAYGRGISAAREERRRKTHGEDQPPKHVLMKLLRQRKSVVAILRLRVKIKLFHVALDVLQYTAKMRFVLMAVFR
jgi:hypothetical protein